MAFFDQQNFETKWLMRAKMTVMARGAGDQWLWGVWNVKMTQDYRKYPTQADSFVLTPKKIGFNNDNKDNYIQVLTTQIWETISTYRINVGVSAEETCKIIQRFW